VREYFLKRISSSFHPQADVLEIGSHDGSMTQLLRNHFEKLDLIEPSTEGYETLNKIYGDTLNIFNSTLEDFVPTKEYDFIFLIHVLEHLDSPMQALDRIRRLLKPNGLLCLMVPNADAYSRRIAVKMGILRETSGILPGEAKQGHLRTYNMETLKSDVIGSGLKVEDAGGILFKPLANFQLDAALEAGIISQDYMEALDELSKEDPKGSSSIYILASR